MLHKTEPDEQVCSCCENVINTHDLLMSSMYGKTEFKCPICHTTLTTYWMHSSNATRKRKTYILNKNEIGNLLSEAR